MNCHCGFPFEGSHRAHKEGGWTYKTPGLFMCVYCTQVYIGDRKIEMADLEAMDDEEKATILHHKLVSMRFQQRWQKMEKVTGECPTCKKEAHGVVYGGRNSSVCHHCGDFIEWVGGKFVSMENSTFSRLPEEIRELLQNLRIRFNEERLA